MVPKRCCESLKRCSKLTGMTTTDTAPQINGDYPLAGDRVGPAWRRLWRELRDGQPHAGLALQRLAPRLDVAPRTIAELLRQAARRGVIEQVGGGRGRKVSYRRTDVPRATATSAGEAR